MTTHTLSGIRMDDLSSEELDIHLRGWLAGTEGRMIATPNPEFLLQSRRDPAFQALLNGSDLSLPDGVGLCYAIAASGTERLQYRHTGVDVLLHLAALCQEMHVPLLLLGGGPGSAEGTAEYLKQAVPGISVFATDPGTIEGNTVSVSISGELIEFMNRLHPTVLAVGLGQGKQERFIRDVLPFVPSVRIAIGVGGALDMLSGGRPRAPLGWRRAGFEWLWRLWIEPRRARRILRASVVFPTVVAWGKLREGGFLSACGRVFQEIIRQWKNASL
ncbi:WecB/TagA/CpsF family glycosyltransferase [Candidatus Uhrbacteria bacterium]|nr:WecB/TagA/CpsF family glycosyltransferase [Candidatus Uhrbacteria bacterium]